MSVCQEVTSGLRESRTLIVRAPFVSNSVSLFSNPFTQGSLEHDLGYIPSI